MIRPLPNESHRLPRGGARCGVDASPPPAGPGPVSWSAPRPFCPSEPLPATCRSSTTTVPQVPARRVVSSWIGGGPERTGRPESPLGSWRFRFGGHGHSPGSPVRTERLPYRRAHIEVSTSITSRTKSSVALPSSAPARSFVSSCECARGHPVLRCPPWPRPRPDRATIADRPGPVRGARRGRRRSRPPARVPSRPGPGNHHRA